MLLRRKKKKNTKSPISIGSFTFSDLLWNESMQGSPFPQFWINDNPLLLRWRGRHALLSMLYHLFLVRGHLGDSCHGRVRVLRLGCGDNSWKLRGTKVVKHACVSVQKSDSWVHMKERGWNTVRALYLFRVMAGTCREAISNFERNRNRWNRIAEKMRQ